MQNDKVRLISNNLLANYISLPKGVKGYLDWTTGLVRLNYNIKEYQNFIKGEDDTWRSYFETLAHEMYHLFQICMSGYLYNYVLTLAYMLWIEELDIESQLIDEELISNFKPSQRFINEVHKININQQYNISVLHIVEGAAFLSHNRMVNPNYTPDDHNLNLILYEDSIYDKSYIFLKSFINEKAFWALPGITYTSLNFSNPVDIFIKMCRASAKYEKDINHDNIIDILDLIIDDIFFESNTHGLYELPLDAALDNDKNLLHPFYSYTLNHMVSKFEKETIVQFMCYPEALGQEFFLRTFRPILFNCANMLIPKSFEAGIFETVNQHEDMMKILAIASFKTVNDNKVGPHFYFQKE